MNVAPIEYIHPETHGVTHDGRDQPVVAEYRQPEPCALVYGVTIRNRRSKIKRNAQCPCRSGKKFKYCHHPRVVQ